MSSTPGLSPAQEHVVRRWFPAVEVIADLSWGLTDTLVLHVRFAEGESIIPSQVQVARLPSRRSSSMFWWGAKIGLGVVRGAADQGTFVPDGARFRGAD